MHQSKGSKLYISFKESGVSNVKYLCYSEDEKANCMYLKGRKDGKNKALFQIDENDGYITFKAVHESSKSWYLCLDSDGFTVKAGKTSSIFKITPNVGKLNGTTIVYSAKMCDKNIRKYLKNRDICDLYLMFDSNIQNMECKNKKVNFSDSYGNLNLNLEQPYMNAQAQEYVHNVNNINSVSGLHSHEEIANVQSQQCASNGSYKAIAFTPLAFNNKTTQRSKGMEECNKKNAVWKVDSEGNGECVPCKIGLEYPDRVNGECVSCGPNAKCGDHNGYCKGTHNEASGVDCLYDSNTETYKYDCSANKCGGTCQGKCGGKAFGMVCVKDQANGTYKCKMKDWWKLILWIIALIILIMIIAFIIKKFMKKETVTNNPVPRNSTMETPAKVELTLPQMNSASAEIF